ncbi:hypothetical protein HDU91_004656 [Kappamyces sp. JEL0680]|nr:hypothetical protein HDU91_004656 [Kappamyces sp. JEL0680]
MTTQERLELQKAAVKADDAIRHLEFEQVAPAIAAARTMIVFFGAAWCVNTQRFTPKFLQVQNMVDEDGLKTSAGFDMAKVECSTDQERFCVSTYKLDGFPTLLVYDGAAG